LQEQEGAMNYENLKSTKKLATNCLCCGRPLRDAGSVEYGVGPICRNKYGFNEVIDEESRHKANQLIWYAALDDVDNEEKLYCADKIEKLGLVNLANKIRERFLSDVITIVSEKVSFGQGKWARECTALLVKTPWEGKDRADEFKLALKAAFDWRDISPVFEEDKFRGWAVKGRGAKKLLWNVLKNLYSGKSCFGPKGYFRVE